MTVSAGWGGARTPANPAVVSGPGGASSRTDGGVLNPDAPAYGEGVELQNLQSAAPMAGTSGAPQGGQAPAGPDLSQVVGLSAPSRDSRPVTAGAAAGAGPGPEALGLPQDPTSEAMADVKSMSPAMLNALFAEASRADASPSFKRLVRTVFAHM